MAVFLPFVHGSDTFPATSMERTEKKNQGRTVVIGIILLAAIGAALTWLRYTSQAPSTVNAQLMVEDGREIFRFDTFGDEAFWGDTLKLHQAIEGASFGGVAALLGMLNSCAAGVTVVNIDNGFGAAYAASRITHS